MLDSAGETGSQKAEDACVDTLFYSSVRALKYQSRFIDTLAGLALTPRDAIALEVAAHILAGCDPGRRVFCGGLPRLEASLQPLLAAAGGALVAADTVDLVISEGRDWAPALRPGGWFIQVQTGDTAPGEPDPADFVPVFSLADVRVFRRKAVGQGKIWAIIPVHGRANLTFSCLRSLGCQTISDSIEVVVVDDASPDETPTMLRTEFPAVDVIEGDGTLWWGGGIALALDTLKPKFAPGDMILFLNNDVTLLPDTLERLRARVTADRGSVWMPMGQAGRGVEACGEAGHMLYRLGRTLRHVSQFHSLSIPVSAAFGRATLLPCEALDDVGSVDAATFPHYFADTDFSMRLAKAGYSLAVDPQAAIRITHDADNTGSHHDFFDSSRSIGEIIRYLGEQRSLGQVKALWRFLSRHDRNRRLQKICAHIWSAFRQHTFWIHLLGPQRREPRL